MVVTTTFVTSPFAIHRQNRQNRWHPHPNNISYPNKSSTAISKRTQVTSSANKFPDAGLISEPGITGTVCTNLFPIPALGKYGWFLSVYDRDTAASVGPFVARISGQNSIRLHFRPGQKPMSTDRSDNHIAFPGISAGNLNVQTARSKLMAQDKDYELRFFERGASELLFNRRNELHVLSSPTLDQSYDQNDDDNDDHAWYDPAPTYRVLSRNSNFQVRELYSSGGLAPRKSPPFEYFGMNLFPIVPLAKYSAFVCVWRQEPGTPSIAIDKRGKELQLHVIDPLELPQSTTAPSPMAKFAVKVFFGSVSDRIITQQHTTLLNAITASQSTVATSQVDLRVLVDNTPNTFTPNRRNELWVQVD